MSEKLTPEQRKAQEDRIKQAKQEYLDRKTRYKGKAVKITEELLKGIQYEEEAYVKLIDGSIGAVTIRPLAEGEIMQVFGILGLSKIENIGNAENFKSEDYDFFWAVASASTGLKVELIKKTFAVGESATLATRILEMSGFTPETNDEVKDF